MSRRKSGQGSLVQLPNGKYRLRKQVGTLNNGRPRLLTVTGTSETDCLKKMRYHEEETKLFDDYNFRNITVTELCYMHLEQHLGEKDRLKPKSADRKESTIKNQISYYPIGNMRLHKVKPIHIRNHIELLISEDKLSISSIVKTLDVINAAYKWAESQNYIRDNPCLPVLESLKKRLKNLEIKRNSTGVVIVLSDLQIDTLRKYIIFLSKSEKDYRAILGLSVLFLLYTGMRIGELCALRWNDWSRSSNTLTIIKTRNIAKNRNSKGNGDTYIANENEVKNCHSRTIKLSDAAIEVLYKIHDLSPKTCDDDYILLNRSAKPSNPSNYGSNINKLYFEAGLPNEVSGAHILRRTCATKMYESGCRVEDIAAYLGDTPETILKHYISLSKRILIDGEVVNVVELPISNRKD